MGATYFKSLARDWALELSLDVNYHDKRVDGEDDPVFNIPTYTVANASARVFQAQGPWGVAITCTNCTNERYISSLGPRIAGKVTPDALDVVSRAGIPRLVTLQLSYSFE